MGARWIAALLLVLALLASGAGVRAAELPQEPFASWDRLANRAERVLDAREASNAALEAMRADLARARSEAQAFQTENAARIGTLNAQLQALGPPPAEGETEPDDIAARRADLTAQIARARAPVAAAEQARARADGLVREVDSLIRARINTALLALGPTPLNPAYWPRAVQELIDYGGRVGAEFAAGAANPILARQLRQGLLFVIGFALAGVGLLIWARPMALRWTGQRAVNGGVLWRALLSGLQLALPLLGALALIHAVRLAGLHGLAGAAVLNILPAAILSIVLANWLGQSLFSPEDASARYLPLDEGDARRGLRVMQAMGVIGAFKMIADAVVGHQAISAESAAVWNLVLIVPAGLALWRLGTLIRKVRLTDTARSAAVAGTVPTGGGSEDGDSADDAAEDTEEALESTRTHEPLTAVVLGLVAKLTLAVAILGPLLAMLGYFAMSRYLVYPTFLTLLVLGVGWILFSLSRMLLTAWLDDMAAQGPADSASQTPGQGTGGLLSVLVGFVLAALAVPLLALIWGARTTDLTEAWLWLNRGVALGDTRIAAGDVLRFVMVFFVVYAATRLLQKVVRTTVLPRTRLDIGAQSAAVAGLGYVGVTLAALLAIAATGLDLSNLAIVAGALSVGIGFGLQTIVSNFVSGIILLVERPIKEGDWIEVGGYSGYVRGVRVRSTEIETFDQATVILPNSDLIAGTVLNWTHANATGRVRVPVGVAYGTDPRKVERILTEIARSHPIVLRRPPPSVLFLGFGNDALMFEIRAFLRDVNWMLRAKSDMNYEIVRRFAHEGIEIPFAQRDIHLRDIDKLVAALGPRPAGADPAAPPEKSQKDSRS